MTSQALRVNYDLIAPLYDEPGRNYDTDSNLVKFLEERANQQRSPVRILDMGCGTGKQLYANRIKYPELHIVGLDLFHGMLLQANKRCTDINWVQGDNTDPPFPDNSFDYITNQFSYHHVKNKSRLIAEVYRVLKPGGQFAITNIDPWSMPGWIVYTYFPASRRRDLSDFLPVDGLTSLMEKTGFHHMQIKRMHRRSEENLSEFLCYAAQRHRTSQLMAIHDDDYEEGIVNLKDSVGQLDNMNHVSSEINLVWITGDKPD
jgi:SAM-dependent methyltransferase